MKNENINKNRVKKFLDKIKKRGSEELDDTIIAAKILGEIILGKSVTEEEGEFLSHKSIDMVKVFAFLKEYFQCYWNCR